MKSALVKLLILLGFISTLSSCKEDKTTPQPHSNYVGQWRITFDCSTFSNATANGKNITLNIAENMENKNEVILKRFDSFLLNFYTTGHTVELDSDQVTAKITPDGLVINAFTYTLYYNGNPDGSYTYEGNGVLKNEQLTLAIISNTNDGAEGCNCEGVGRK
jgi:hypothetical protein